MADPSDPRRPDAGSSAYRGTDRRSLNNLRGTYYGGPDRRLTAAFRSESATLQVVLWLAGLASVAAVVGRALHSSPHLQVTTVIDLRNLSSGALVLAGTLLLVIWVLSGGARHALDGAALLLLGGGTLLTTAPWGTSLHHTVLLRTLSPASCVALSIPALVILTRSTVVRQVDSAVRPLAILLMGAAAAAALLVVEAGLRTSTLLQSTHVWQALLTAVVAGWVIAGGRRLVAVPGEATVGGTCAVGLALIGLGLGDALLAVGLRQGLRWALIGGAVQLVCAAVVVRVTVAWLLRALSHDSIRRLQLAGQVADLSIVLADERQVRQRMVRDARKLMKVVRHPNVAPERTIDLRDGVPGPPTIDLSAAEVRAPAQPAAVTAAAVYSDPPPTTTRSWRL